MQYFVGEWDGTTFRPYGDARAPRWLDHGPDCYAGITWEGLPDGERAMIAWMSNWSYVAATPAQEYRGQMTLVRRLQLQQRGDDLVLAQDPVLPVHELGREPGGAEGAQEVDTPAVVTVAVPRSGGSVVLDLGAGGDLEIGVAADQLYVDRSRLAGAPLPVGFAASHRAPVTSDDAVVLTVVVDSGSVEVFAEEGRTVLTELVFPAIDRFAVTAGEATEPNGLRIRRLAAS
jgi:sucrose-6-phosphate hydrolase SacC (GH32 family)